MSDDCPEYIWLHPDRMIGMPCIGGTRIDVETVTERIWWGESGDEIAAYYEISRAQVLLACWYQARHGTRTWRKRWDAWECQNWDALAWNRWDRVPFPPARRKARVL